MRKLFFSAAILMAVSSFIANGQEPSGGNPAKDAKSEKYRRSSLCHILIDEGNMPKREVILESFLNAPLPDKYNDHNISERTFCPDNWKLSADDHAAYAVAVKAYEDSQSANVAEGEKPKKKGGFGKFMKAAAGTALALASDSEESVMVDSKDKEEYAVIANKHLLEQNVAKQLFDKWFVTEDGGLSMGLVHERGLYDASVLDRQTASNAVEGLDLLRDAGKELINNTFVVVTRFRYLSKDELVAEIDAAAQAVAGAVNENVAAAARLGTMGVKASLGAGYYVRTTSYLFQLNWNEDTENRLKRVWRDAEGYDAADFFALNYVGQESAFANVKAGIFTNKSEEELIDIATINATDAVLAKLAKKYEVFRTKTPLVVEGDKLYAYIGAKEGLEGGEKFEVLEQVMDESAGTTVYKRKGTISVVKGKVWDNRFMADEELAATGKGQSISATEFEGSANGLYSGMLLRQIK